ncbi:MAG: cysteine synthase family protein [Verrucomicrobiales bacterium]|nr:cysteine synthase family protein [Verrucomicrobiales bacterium]MCP5526951.1 cysteine synthase family protein [Verrucomicrobiales bacterium]
MTGPTVPPILSLIGNTPTLPLRFEPEGVTLFAKCEFLNPSGSVKDRFAAEVLIDARKRGVLRADSVVVECTSGNTGIALAMVGAAMGCRVRILMGEGASVERRYLMEQLGAEVRLFKADRGYRTGIELAQEMAAADPRVFLPDQFANPLNSAEHERDTAAELIRQIDRPIDAFVAGYGTGGTLAGVGRALKARHPGARVLAMEPAEAAMLGGEMPCCHWIEGVAGGFLPPLLQRAPIDGEIAVKSAEALAMTRRLNREFGLLVGTSSGANVAAALRVAGDLGPAATVATLLCDRAERYFSTRLFRAAAAA